MEKDLKAIKKSIAIVTADKDVNELVMDYISKEYDCFGRAYLEGHSECKQCVVITEFKDFETGAMRRDPLWAVCLETCRFLEQKASVPQVQSESEPQEKEEEKEKEVAPEMQDQMESSESLMEKEPEAVEETKSETETPATPEIPVEKPKKRSVNTEGHSKTMYRTCSKCGKKCSMYESTYNNAVKRYGSVEAMNEKYLCKNCRKEQ